MFEKWFKKKHDELLKQQLEEQVQEARRNAAKDRQDQIRDKLIYLTNPTNGSKALYSTELALTCGRSLAFNRKPITLCPGELLSLADLYYILVRLEK